MRLFSSELVDQAVRAYGVVGAAALVVGQPGPVGLGFDGGGDLDGVPGQEGQDMDGEFGYLGGDDDRVSGIGNADLAVRPGRGVAEGRGDIDTCIVRVTADGGVDPRKSRQGHSPRASGHVRTSFRAGPVLLCRKADSGHRQAGGCR